MTGPSDFSSLIIKDPNVDSTSDLGNFESADMKTYKL